jgi:hypothetical protein
MSHRLPRLFIGSSSEGKAVAEAVREHLTNDADVIFWDEAFKLGKSFSDSLRDQLDTADFAVLVMTPDDTVDSRGQQSYSPRDNVVFEFGWFAGRIGLDRCFCLQPESPRLKIPTDLLGITTARYRTDHAQGILSAVGAACNQIRRGIGEAGVREPSNPIKAFVSRVYGYWWEYITPVRVSALGFLEMTVDEVSTGIRIKGLAHRIDGSRAADWWTEGCGVNPLERKLIYVWKGRYLDRPDRMFEGFGDFSFNESSDIFVRGHGVFAEMDSTDLQLTRKKTGKITRCSLEDVEVMKSGDKQQIAVLIEKRLKHP